MHSSHSQFWEGKDITPELNAAGPVQEDEGELVSLMQFLESDLQTISQNFLQWALRSNQSRASNLPRNMFADETEEFGPESSEEARKWQAAKRLEEVMAYVFEAVLPMLTTYLAHADPAVALRPGPLA